MKRTCKFKSNWSSASLRRYFSLVFRTLPSRMGLKGCCAASFRQFSWEVSRNSSRDLWQGIQSRDNVGSIAYIFLLIGSHWERRGARRDGHQDYPNESREESYSNILHTRPWLVAVLVEPCSPVCSLHAWFLSACSLPFCFLGLQVFSWQRLYKI